MTPSFCSEPAFTSTASLAEKIKMCLLNPIKKTDMNQLAKFL